MQSGEHKKGQVIPIKEWVILYSDPSYLFLTFEPLDQREKLKLIRGGLEAEILENDPALVSVNDSNPEHKIKLWKVKISSVKEQLGCWWQAVGDPEDVADLEGWVGTHAFKPPSKNLEDDNE